MNRREFLSLTAMAGVSNLYPHAYGQTDDVRAAHTAAAINLDLAGTTQAFPHAWERCAGSDRAVVGLRDQWRRDLTTVHDKAGIESVRFHGLFNDEMGVCTGGGGEPLRFNFLYVDQVYDAMLERGVRPFVELSYMPKALASSDKAIFFYRGNVSPPNSLDGWADLVTALAAYKVNVYSPYFETSFHYASNPIVPPHGAGLTPEEGRELAAYAARYHVTIVPEQEAFGHLHHLLAYQQYAALAETPMDSVLAPGQPGSIDLISQWFTELASVFPGPMLHIGADETFDLGKGRTDADKRGLGVVYVDFLLDVHQRLAPLHRTLLFWGDIAMQSPEEIKRLPKDIIAVAWVYEPHPEGYAKWIRPYVVQNIQTWVAPGVNNWRRVYPDDNDAFQNIQRFVADGQANHSTGMLNTSWNDDGEELFPLNWYGVLYGAAAAWQPGTSDISRYQASYGPAFHGDTSGAVNQAQQEMMAALGPLGHDETLQMTDLLFWADPWSPIGRVLDAKLRPLIPEMRLHAEKAIALAEQARHEPGMREIDALDGLELGARKLDFIGEKFQSADRMLELYDEAYRLGSDPKHATDVIRDLWNVGGRGGLSLDLRDGYSETGREYGDLWNRVYRPYYLENISDRYRASADLWQRRSDGFFQALVAYRATGKLPPITALPGMEGVAMNAVQPQAR